MAYFQQSSMLGGFAGYDPAMSSFADRVEQAIHEMKGATKASLARGIGISKQAVGDWASGKTQNVRPENLVAAARWLGVRIEWLAIGEPPMRPAPTASADSALRTLDPTRYAFVPKYPVHFHGGSGGTAPEVEEVESLLAFRSDWLRGKGLRAENLAVVPVKGTSMEPLISEGDIVLLDREAAKNRIESGRIYGIDYDGDLRVKRLHTQHDGSITISSDNKSDPANRDEHVPPEKLEALLLRIIGRVVWAGGDL